MAKTKPSPFDAKARHAKYDRIVANSVNPKAKKAKAKAKVRPPAKGMTNKKMIEMIRKRRKK